MISLGQQLKMTRPYAILVRAEMMQLHLLRNITYFVLPSYRMGWTHPHSIPYLAIAITIRVALPKPAIFRPSNPVPKAICQAKSLLSTTPIAFPLTEIVASSATPLPPKNQQVLPFEEMSSNAVRLASVPVTSYFLRLGHLRFHACCDGVCCGVSIPLGAMSCSGPR
jgi:hypothetical protein